MTNTSNTLIQELQAKRDQIISLISPYQVDYAVNKAKAETLQDIIILIQRREISDNSPLIIALEKIKRWVGEFPETGKKWTDGSPCSYGAAYGSNGERDFMRNIASEALFAYRATVKKVELNEEDLIHRITIALQNVTWEAPPGVKVKHAEYAAAICKAIEPHLKAVFDNGYRSGMLQEQAIAASTKREASWVKIDDFRGNPLTDPRGWWWNVRDKQVELDEILIGKDGKIEGKGGCGADNCSHVMIAESHQLPSPPLNSIEDGISNE